MNADNNHPVRRSSNSPANFLGVASRRHASRRGAIVVLAAILLVIMMGMMAFSIDVGYMYTLESQLQRSVDAAALAGAGALVDGDDEANERVVEYLVRNPIGGDAVISGDVDLESRMSAFLQDHDDDLEVRLGHWDADTRTFSESDDLPSTISVAMTYHNNPLFFARFLGEKEFSVTAESVAMYQPRDIMVVLDFSGSMNDDTEFNAIDSLGRATVEANLAQCWADLGSPTYGDLTFAPKYVTLTSGSNPSTSVEYRGTSVFVSSSHTLQRVKLTFSNGSTKTWNSPGGKTGTFAYSNRQVTYVEVKSNNKTRTFDFDDDDIDEIIEEALGLDHVNYPYPGGSWRSYINWCISSNGQNASAGGYRWKFGTMSLMVYWLETQYGHDDCPDLWKASAQPVTALKDATSAFMDFIQQIDTNDRVGLSIYNGPDGEGYLESGLTHDFEQISATVTHRQAGHYHNYTNIGGGLHTARIELEENGRPGAFKMVVLMTDGQANWVNGRSNTSGARNYLLDEAELCAGQRYPILTVSLGAGADTGLMQQVADITPKGKHFNIPGGQTGDEYYEDLLEVFREIAKDRPLKLVK